LKFDGLFQRDLPVTAYPQSQGRVQFRDPELWFLEPHRLRDLETKVRGRCVEPVQLVVYNPRNFWLSVEPVALAGGRVTVRLQPATRMEVRQYEGGGPGMVVLGEQNGEIHSAIFRRKLVWKGQRERPAWVATLIVPRKRTVLSLGDAEESWEHVATCRGAFELIEIDR